MSILTLECYKNDGVTAWINENSFYCGRIVSEINFLGDYKMNNNIFYSPRIENIVATFNIGQNNYFYNCRLEGTPTFNFASGTFNNIFYCTWGNFMYTSYTGQYSQN